MAKTISVRVFKDGAAFLSGDFSVEDHDYDVVKSLLGEVQMDRDSAESMLAGYMHAGDVGQVTDEMGKLAMIAAVYLMEEGLDAVDIVRETPTEAPTLN